MRMGATPRPGGALGGWGKLGGTTWQNSRKPHKPKLLRLGLHQAGPDNVTVRSTHRPSRKKSLMRLEMEPSVRSVRKQASHLGVTISSQLALPPFVTTWLQLSYAPRLVPPCSHQC